MENILIGLAGNPNVGKTTLFNQLTGLRQHVGNWPGKTVEKAEGSFNFKDTTMDVVDLPGNYALTAHSIEEIISRDFIVDEDSDVIVNILDATNIERNLYLTVQMMELGANMVIALNMNKLAKREDININVPLMSELLGIPVVEIEANNKTGTDDLLQAVKKAAENPTDSSQKLVYGNELNEHLAEIQEEIEKDKNLLDVPSIWTAIKLLEDDDVILAKIEESSNSRNILKVTEKVKKHLKDIFNEPSEEIIANARYSFIGGLVAESVKRPEVAKKSMTDKIDAVVTNRILGLPIFLAIIYLVFQITFTLGAPFQELLEGGFEVLGEATLAALGESWFSSLLVDGIIGGVGGVLVFLPNIILMFLLLSILEDSGYLARAAFVMDRLMHKFVGLHGKAFIPMILGFGCGVPALMATRTLEHERDRLLTMMVVPFMSCTARLPVYLIFIAAFFTTFQGEILFSIYLIGIAIAIIVATILKRTMFQGITPPFVMEIPSYKIPSIKGVLLHTWEKSYNFVKKAGTIILAAAIIIWVLSSLPADAEYGSQESITGQIGTAIAPVFAPMGFGEWQPAVALIFGVLAKEIVVSTFSSLFGVDEEGDGITASLHTLFTPLSAFAFLIFVLLYVPCFAALATVKTETNSWKWPVIMFLITTTTAYIVSTIVFQGGMLLGFG